MIYSSPEFIFLFLLILAAFSAASSYRLRFAILLSGSFVFYAWSGLFDTYVFILVILVSWLAAALSARWPSAKRWLIPAGISVIIGNLVFWKYASWLIGQIQVFQPSFLAGRRLFLPLPLGISFFTLQSVAYLADYSSGQAELASLPLYALFKGFFAQLVAGPIVRASQLLPQLRRLERPTAAETSLGLTLFSIGFAKKVAIADRMAFFVELVFSSPERFGRLILLKALLGYSVQVWADFSGYTDMGRGAALMLGIRLPENFLSPYFSQTPSEFWRRWHITLSEWIRDYLFTPLALWCQRASARGIFYAATLTMLIAGLWHGAGWTYALFGFYHGLLLVLERQVTFPRFSRRLEPLRAAVRASLMFGLVLLGWLIFRAGDLHLLWRFLAGIVWDRGAHEAAATGRSVYPALALCLALQGVCFYDLGKSRWVFLSPAREALARRYERAKASGSTLAPVAGFCAGALLAAVLAGVLYLRPPLSRAFIYFQF